LTPSQTRQYCEYRNRGTKKSEREGEDELHRAYQRFDFADAMKRRLFLQSSVSSALVAPAFAHANPYQHDASTAGRLFYDERFAQARVIANRLARQSADKGALAPVNGDLTAPWVGELRAAASHGALRLRGVTTESFYFCLKTMLQPHGVTATHIERVGRDLHAWEITTGVATKDGMV